VAPKAFISWSSGKDSAFAFYEALIAGWPRPKFSWRFEADGSIAVDAETRPISAVLWQATNPDARDFRLEAIGAAYRPAPLAASGAGSYRAPPPEPARGWTAYFVELSFASGGLFPFKFTTAVRVAPDTLPFGPPPELTAHCRKT